MAAATCMKRLVKERERMPQDNNDFWVGFKDDNLRQFSAYIIGPDDSVYKHKLVKLKFDIPEKYPLVPPKVKKALVAARGEVADFPECSFF